MKTCALSVLLPCLLATAVSAADLKAKQLAQFPPAVRQAAQALVGDGKLLDLERAIEHGRVVFEGEFRRDGTVRNFTLAPDGTLISKQVFEKELPAPVAQTLRAQLTDAQLGDLYWTNDDGDPAYHIELTRGGAKRSLTIAPDGWLAGREITPADLPVPVRQAVQQQLNGATPSSLERADDGEEVTFEVTVEINKRPRTWIFGEEGDLIAVEVNFPDLPVAVQKAIQDRQGNNRLAYVFKADEAGVTYYEATFVKGGLKHAVTVLNDGKVVSLQIPPGESPAAVQKAVRDQNAFLVRLEQNFEAGGGNTFDVLMRSRGKVIRLELKADGTAK